MVEKSTNIKLALVGLFLSNYLAQYHVRAMAKLLNKNHVTLLPHLKSLEKDGILVVKIAGKNKNYSLNFDNIITKNYLISAEIAESTAFLENVFLIKKITAELFRLQFPGTVIIFGSYAKRTFKDDSDIDLFYIGKITDSQIQEIKKAGKTYGKIVNIKKSTQFESALRKKGPLVLEIVKNHIILQNPEPFVNALWRYYDAKR